MRLARFYEPQPLVVHQDIQLSDFAAHHMVHVLRGKVGDRCTLFNGEGNDYQAVVKTICKSTVWVRLLQLQPRECESPLQVQLAQAISTRHKMDYTIQKATELGVSSIAPLITRRSLPLGAKHMQTRWQHWHRVMISACEQCGRNRLPVLHPVMPLNDWLRRVTAELRLLLYHRSPKSLHHYALDVTQSIVLLIGAEGGLDGAEMQRAQHFNFQPIVLGPRVLRTETAALTALSILQYLSGDL